VLISALQGQDLMLIVQIMEIAFAKVDSLEILTGGNS